MYYPTPPAKFLKLRSMGESLGLVNGNGRSNFHQPLTGMEATNRSRLRSASPQSLIKITEITVVSTTLKYHLCYLEFIVVLRALLDLTTSYVNKEALLLLLLLF